MQYKAARKLNMFGQGSTFAAWHCNAAPTGTTLIGTEIMIMMLHCLLTDHHHQAARSVSTSLLFSSSSTQFPRHQISCINFTLFFGFCFAFCNFVLARLSGHIEMSVFIFAGSHVIEVTRVVYAKSKYYEKTLSK